MKRTSQLVRLELSKNPKSRDSDKLLYTNILQTLGADLTEKQIEIVMSISPESVRRTRQKFNEKGLYLGSPEVQKERRQKSYEVQQVIVGIDPSSTSELLERKPKYVTRIIDGEEVVVVE